MNKQETQKGSTPTPKNFGVSLRNKRGFTLLLSVVISGIVLAIGLTLLGIALKQFQISSIGLDSEMAFQAANAGVECVKYWDNSSEQGGKFDVDTPVETISCFGESENTLDAPVSGQEQTFEFDWTNTTDSPQPSDYVCTNVSIWKYYDSSNDQSMSGVACSASESCECPAGVECTVIQSRGYNKSCNELDSLKTVERELFVRY